ncbi:hypothetical protein B0H63DRAFT_87070 [Podospora didyma]|uniref:AAA+ ATPase domain-containing protein n=1 Tax=Podospora didyma TaxID=330526 RepID=A0AAE0K0J5_9PEZI|nr:hypothetical protein B0H63DRAFT_87070 [Podospora didyma]
MSENKSNSAASDGKKTALSSSVASLQEQVQDYHRRITALEEKLSPNFESAGQRMQRAFSSTQDQDNRTEPTDDGSLDAHEYIFLEHKNTIPEVRECAFAEFKNRFNPSGEDGRYAVDVLVSGLYLHQEIQEEHTLRDRLFEHRGLTPSREIIGKQNRALARAVKMAKKATDAIARSQGDDKWPRRVRIQSPALLRILAKVNGEKWTDRQRTYYRPFNSLVYQHANVKAELAKLEKKLASAQHADEVNMSDHESGSVGSSGGEDDDTIEESPLALECLRAYVEFIDKRVMPDYHRFETMDYTSNAKVRFSDLWYLFRTGEFVYRQVNGERPDRRDFRTGKRIWKTYFLDSVPERLLPTASDDAEIRDAAIKNDEAAFTLACYYVDYTGDEFCVVKDSITIDQFFGEVLVTALPIYPMRFCPDWESHLAFAKETGESLLEFIETKHCSYNGWTLMRDSSGNPTVDQNGNKMTQSEHVNSEIMVDFNEAFQSCPAWRPQRGIMREKTTEGLTILEDFRICWWSGPGRTNLFGETTELIPVKSGVNFKQRNQHLNEDPFVRAIRKNAKGLRPTTKEFLTDDAKILLAGRVFGYVFQERKFAQLAVNKLRKLSQTGLALDALKISPVAKKAIRGAIEGHFIQRDIERKMEKELCMDVTSLDLFQGKGTGLFILLHGVPGVGKTATAEAIAQANGKALFKITVGDLGTTPERLESALRDIFRLASLWDCILLLDEVDTFFSQRTRSEAADKNAMVSVFLRVLDYYDGILFLTTNRAGVLDEAFKSRIHYKILYNDLILEQTLDIWKLNIKRLRKIEDELASAEKRATMEIDEKELLAFARQLFQRAEETGTGPGRWNGRQIRNAFQVARSLAYYERELRAEEIRQRQAEKQSRKRSGPEEDPYKFNPPVLDVRFFKTTHTITASFDDYCTAMRGGTNDAQLALEGETRYDDYQDWFTGYMRRQYIKEHNKNKTGAPAAVAAAATAAAQPFDEQDDGGTGDDNSDDAGPIHPPRKRPRLQVDPGFSSDNNRPPQRKHRGSFKSRPRSGSQLSTGIAASPPSPIDYTTRPQRPAHASRSSGNLELPVAHRAGAARSRNSWEPRSYSPYDEQDDENTDTRGGASRTLRSVSPLDPEDVPRSVRAGNLGGGRQRRLSNSPRPDRFPVGENYEEREWIGSSGGVGGSGGSGRGGYHGSHHYHPYRATTGGKGGGRPVSDIEALEEDHSD